MRHGREVGERTGTERERRNHGGEDKRRNGRASGSEVQRRHEMSLLFEFVNEDKKFYFHCWREKSKSNYQEQTMAAVEKSHATTTNFI